MSIGTSLGAYFDDAFHSATAGWDPKKYDENTTPDNNVQSDLWTQVQRTSQENKPIPISDVSAEPVGSPYSGSNLGPLSPLPKTDTTSPEPVVAAPSAPSAGSSLSMVNAFKGMFNPSTDEDMNIIKGIGKAFALPGDVLSGKVQPGSVQEIERAADLAGLMVGGPAPVAAKMADGTLGSFMGVTSKTIDKTALYKAQDLHLQGVHPDDIWAETGTFKGADGRWRQEIDDSKAKLHDSAFDHTITPAIEGSDGMGRGGWGTVGGREAEHTVSLKNPTKPKSDSLEDLLATLDKKPLSLDKVLDHPELYKAYPELRGIKVQPMPEAYKDNIGMMRGGRELYLRNDLHPDFAKQVILHETQHAIQEIEGFAKGGSPQQFLPKELGQAKKEFEDIRAEAEANTVKELSEKFPKNEDIYNVNEYKNLIREEQKTGKTDKALANLKKYTPDAYKRLQNVVNSEDLILETEKKAYDSYYALGGEVESRNVEARMNYDKFRRAFVPPVTK